MAPVDILRSISYIERNTHDLLIAGGIESIFYLDPINAYLAAKVKDAGAWGIIRPDIIRAIIHQHVAGRVIWINGWGGEIQSQRWGAGGEEG